MCVYFVCITKKDLLLLDYLNYNRSLFDKEILEF